VIESQAEKDAPWGNGYERHWDNLYYKIDFLNWTYGPQSGILRTHTTKYPLKNSPIGFTNHQLTMIGRR